jgi:circadian clock protein KaiC
MDHVSLLRRGKRVTAVLDATTLDPPGLGDVDAPRPKLATGIDGLDHILDGGLLRGNSLLIEGPPGSGKSTLGVRIIHEGIVRHGEPGLIIAFEEFPRQIYREAASAGVDLRAHEASGMLRVLWTPPARILEGFSGRDDLVDRIVGELGVRRLLIDSITHFKRVASSELELREILATVLTNLKLRGVSTFLVKEMEGTGDRDIAFEEYLVDASIRLYHDPGVDGPGDRSRMLEVRKTRGQGHLSGRHPFELGRTAFAVYPRLRPSDVEARVGSGPLCLPRRRVPTGVPGLDAMLHGGAWSGTMVLVSGSSGSGRTALGLQFALEGVAAGERSLVFSMKDGAEELCDRVAMLPRRAADVEAGLQVIAMDPLECSLEKAQARLLDEIVAFSPDRLVFDGLDDLRLSGLEEAAVGRQAAFLARIASASGATVLATEGVAGAAAGTHERLANCVVRLQEAPDRPAAHGIVTVRKHARSAHERHPRPYVIESQGLVVG